VTAPFPFLFYPALFLWVRLAVGRTRRLEPVHLLHAVPFASELLLMLPYWLQSADAKLQQLRWYQSHPPGGVSLLLALVVQLYVLVYLALSLREVLRARRQWRAVAEAQASEQRVQGLDPGALATGQAAAPAERPPFAATDALGKLAAMRVALGYNLVLPVFALLGMVAVTAGVAPASLRAVALAVPFSGVLVALLGWAGLRRPDALPPAPAPASVEPSGPTEQLPAEPKYGKSRLDDEIAATYLDELLAVMDQGQAWRDEELNLASLAERVGLPHYLVSQVLNRQLGKSFNDFVNEYRIQAVQQAFADPGRADDTVLEIAYEVGFRNKSTFNAAFKRHTGTTPSAWRKRHGTG
jgi:AraC-like DNA-binding protein